MIPFISALHYKERLKLRARLISLENHRLRADLLEVFKILKDFAKVDPATHFSMSDRISKRTHAETSDAKGKTGAKKTLLLYPSNRRTECTTRPHLRNNDNPNVQDRLTTATPWGIYELEATACPSWPSHNMKDGLTGKSMLDCSSSVVNVRPSLLLIGMPEIFLGFLDSRTILYIVVFASFLFAVSWASSPFHSIQCTLSPIQLFLTSLFSSRCFPSM